MTLLSSFFQGPWPAPDLGNWMCLNVADEFKVGSRLDSTRSEFKSKIWLFIFFGFFNWQIFKYSLPVRCEYTQSSQFLAISPTETFTLCQSQCHMPSLSWCTNLTAINVTKCRFQCHHCNANHTLSSYSSKQHSVNNIKHCQHVNILHQVAPPTCQTVPLQELKKLSKCAFLYGTSLCITV